LKIGHFRSDDNKAIHLKWQQQQKKFLFMKQQKNQTVNLSDEEVGKKRHTKR
jgi:hypothetical protein